MTAKLPPPILVLPTCTTVSSGWNFRLAFLYGSLTRRQASTTGWAITQLSATALVSPTRPMMWLSRPTLS